MNVRQPWRLKTLRVSECLLPALTSPWGEFTFLSCIYLSLETDGMLLAITCNSHVEMNVQSYNNRIGSEVHGAWKLHVSLRACLPPRPTRGESLCFYHTFTSFLKQMEFLEETVILTSKWISNHCNNNTGSEIACLLPWPTRREILCGAGCEVSLPLGECFSPCIPFCFHEPLLLRALM